MDVLCNRRVFIPTQIALVPQHLRFVTVSVVALSRSMSSLCFLSSSILVLLTVTNRRATSSVNARTQLEIAAEHAHDQAPEDDEKKPQ